jgi:hypothetical protein
MNFRDILPGALEVGGTLLSAYGQNEQGDAALEKGIGENALAQFQAEQMRQNANSAVAASQRQVVDVQRQADMIASRALAVASMNGGASDPTVINMIARTAGEAAYRQSIALYQGQDKARALNLQADATEYAGSRAEQAGRETKSASDIGVLSTLIKGGSSLYSKYAGGGPKTDGDTANVIDGGGDAGGLFGSGGM